VDFPSAWRRCCHRRLSASPPSIAASLEPVVEQPTASPLSPGAFQRLLRMLTQRTSIAAVCGYSSLSIMFLSKHSDISLSACGSIQVLTKVARLSRALPSSINSSWMIWYATSGASSPLGSSCRGRRWLSSVNSGAMARSTFSPEAAFFGCASVMGSPRSRRRRAFLPMRKARHLDGYEQLRDEAVDWAADLSSSAGLVRLLTASEPESELGTPFPADSKALQALSS